MMYKRIVRPALFRISQRDPEIAHELAMHQLARISHIPPAQAILEKLFTIRSPQLEREVFGLHFPNPVGLAGGFDKNGIALPTLAALGFGFIEAGGVTSIPQPGQPRPRVFRLSADEALINRMGLPSQGADAIAARLATQPHPKVPIGWQLAKSKVTPLEDAAEDYCYSLERLHPFADYFSLNVSSPNTPGLRSLQDREPLRALLAAIIAAAHTSAERDGSHPRPVLVKLSPDLSWPAIDDALEICLETGVAGIIATNTTLDHSGTHGPDARGGLSGRPLAARAREVVRYISQQLEGRLPVVGVGGIFDPEDARRMFDAGAALIQVYTGFIYEGPGIARRINRALLADEEERS
jgi:dihydroorotate dehydrogenase